MDWIHPWIGLDWIGLDWVQYLVEKIGLDWIGLEVFFDNFLTKFHPTK